jgi:predicted neuraminidase
MIIIMLNGDHIVHIKFKDKRKEINYLRLEKILVILKSI